MSTSEAWNDIQPVIHSSRNWKNYTDWELLNTILGMVEVAQLQSNESYSQIPFFFSRINNILDYLVREGEIKTTKQSLFFQRKVMEKLNITKIDKHIELLNLFKKKPILKDRFDSSIKTIIEYINQWKSFQEASHEQWIKKDKKYLNKDITNISEYKQFMKSYSIQKYGEIP